MGFQHLCSFENFWLPAGTKWNDSENPITLPIAKDLLTAIPITVIIFFIRHFVKRVITIPFGKFIELKDKTQWTDHNHTFETAFLQYGEKLTKDHEKLQELAKREGVEIRKVERWLKKRIKCQQPSALSKFGETSWKLVWYTASSSFGFYSLWDKSWFWDVQECWVNFPNQDLPKSIMWYYLISMGCTLSQMIIHLHGEKKKDYWQMIVHHVSTISLLSLSYISNSTRIGSLVLLCHDFLDIFLNLALSTSPTRRKALSNFVFLIFVFVWILTRLTFFPFLIYSTVTQRNFNVFPAFAINCMMLIVLQILHYIWTYYIYKIVAGMMAKGVAKDSRSCSESSE